MVRTVEVDLKKAQQLLRDFPHDWETIGTSAAEVNKEAADFIKEHKKTVTRVFSKFALKYVGMTPHQWNDGRMLVHGDVVDMGKEDAEKLLAESGVQWERYRSRN